jgi:beta-galactosidase
MNKIMNKQFIYGAQYYRAPTPLPEEWEYDMEKMGAAGIDTVQIRVQWRKNEPSEGQYEFEDVDRLFDVAAKHNKKVIFKFLMENAPDYIFQKYSGSRIGLDNQEIRPGAHGAFYIGGWLPCFDNPDVIARAKAFVKICVQRYKNREELLLWNIWNEPRSRPLGECCCEHSINSYREYLRNKYKVIENLNNFYGKGWESFETVDSPGMPHDYAEVFEWRQWASSAVTSRLDFMYKTVKELDATRPVISHVGCCSVIQDAAGDCSDDIANAAAVDFYGTSLPTADEFSNFISESRCLMICDWMRHVDPNYWVYELYPDWGDWTKPVTVNDYKFKVWACLAAGAKGILYWQYRAERLGCENNLAGLVNIDGSFKEISHESGRIAQFIHQNEDFLSKAEVVEDPIGILYSRESDLISSVENSCGTVFKFDQSPGFYCYNKSIQGAHALFRELGFVPQFIDVRRLAECLGKIRVLYIPQLYIPAADTLELLQQFVANGGKIIAEEGLALRQQNTWLNPHWPADGFAALMGARIKTRIATRFADEKIVWNDITVKPGEFISHLECLNAQPVAYWQDSNIAAAATKNSLFIGTAFGAAFLDNSNSSENYLELIRNVLTEWGIQPMFANLPKRIYARKLRYRNQVMHIIFNRSDNTFCGIIDGCKLRIKTHGIGICFSPYKNIKTKKKEEKATLVEL